MSKTQILFLFAPKRDVFPNKPYYLDGDAEMYTEEELDKRSKLKEDEDLKKYVRDVYFIF